MKKIILLFIATLGFISITIAQEKVENEKEVGNKGFHQLSFMLSHSIIGEGIVNGTKKSISAPSLGFDYSYWFQNKWAVGLQTDIITESFKIEDNGGAVIDRSTPIAIVPAISFKPINHSMFILGLGKEYAKEGEFTLTRLGYEYSFELPKKYELSFGITYDKKWEAYDIWTFGIIVSKLFK
jgi:hypothetical protein